MNAVLRQSIWKALDKLVRQHRAFEDAQWALESAELEVIEDIARSFRPEDPAAKYEYLFNDHLPDIGRRRADDAAAYQGAVSEERAKAARAVFEVQGLPGVRQLAGTVNYPIFLGWGLGESGVKVDEDAVLADLDNADNHLGNFAAGFLKQRVESAGFPWIDAMLPRLSDRPLAQARVLRATYELKDAWQRAEKLGRQVQSAYWKEFVAIGLGAEFALVNETARHLLEHERPAGAADLLALYADNVAHPVDADLVADALEALIQAPTEDQSRISPYELQRLLEVLRKSTLDQDRIAILEWRLLPGLGYGVPAPNLERRLARAPSFFVELLSMCFKRADGVREHEVTTEVAQNAFRLLQEWEIVPGSTERNGEVDGAKLNSWVDEARRLLAKADRGEIGDLHIGQVFAHAREDPDGTWPTLPVRNSIETLANRTVERGFRTETYNKRGPTWRGLADGGGQEYELADKFDHWAALVANEWPRSAAVLRSIAEDYRAQARAEDEEAERFKKGLDLG
jgi:hypothetical protein